MTTFDHIVTIFRNPSLFIGIIAMLGLILQRKSASDVITGTFRTIIGMLILFAGVDVIINAVGDLANIFTEIFKLEGAAMPDFGVFIDEFGFEIGMVMLLGFVGNIIIARFTPLKAIYLTGNLLFWFPMLTVSIASQAGMSSTDAIIFGTSFQLIIIATFPNLMRPLVKDLTGSDSFTIAHTAAPFCIMGNFIGVAVTKITGRNPEEKSAEAINFPSKLSFLKSTTITSSLIIFLMYLVLAPFLSSSIREQYYGTGFSIFTYSLLKGVGFGAGLTILLTGTRMMLAEIVPAFKGISSKLVPNSIPGLDIPMVFPYAPTSLMLGFIAATVASIGTIFLLGNIGVLSYPLIPLTIAAYFDVAPGSIFANKKGGALAAIIHGLLGGAILMLMAAWTIPMLIDTTADFIMLYGGNEFSLWTAIANGAGQLPQLGVYVFAGATALAFVLIGVFARKKAKA